MGLLSAYLYNFKVLCDFPFGASQVLIPTYIPTKMQAASGLLWTIQTTAQEYFTIKIIYYGKIKTTVNLNPLLHDCGGDFSVHIQRAFWHGRAPVEHRGAGSHGNGDTQGGKGFAYALYRAVQLTLACFWKKSLCACLDAVYPPVFLSENALFSGC